MRLTGLAVAATLVLAACGGGTDDAATPPSAPVTDAPGLDDGELFREIDTPDVEAPSSGDDVDDEPSPETTVTPTIDDADSTISTEPDSDDGNSDGTDATTGGGAGGDTADTAGGSTTGDGDGGVLIDPDGSEEVCGLVREAGDAFDRLADLDGLDADVDVDDIRAALDDVVRSLRAIPSPDTVAADAELLAQSVELQIAQDLDDRELTVAEEDFLDGDELRDAGNRLADFAVDACGVELL